jgi:DNA-binding PadR family transcriptional regulator
MSAGGELQLFDLLETVEEFGRASLELIAWEFSYEAADVRPIWRDLVDQRLLAFVEQDESGEQMYELTALGAERLAALRRRKAS